LFVSLFSCWSVCLSLDCPPPPQWTRPSSLTMFWAVWYRLSLLLICVAGEWLRGGDGVAQCCDLWTADPHKCPLSVTLRRHSEQQRRSDIVNCNLILSRSSGVPRSFVRSGVQQIQLRTEGRENGDRGAVAP
jgi:hypothetical protein